MTHKLEHYSLLECDELPFEGVRFSHLEALPKIDLHRHLVGAVRPEVLTYIADKLGVTIPTFGNDAERIRKASVLLSPISGGYHSFLHKRIWSAFQTIFRDPRGCSNAMYWAIADASRDNVVYVEFRVSPYGVNPEFPLSLAQFLEALSEGVAAAARDYPATVAKIILSVGRRSVFGKWPANKRSEYYDRLVATACKFRELVVGFDLSGDEDEYPNHLFVDFAQRIKARGFKLTVHAGETGNPCAIWDALNLLHTDRIGHGIGMRYDSSLMKRVKEESIAVELCPTSNWLVGGIELTDHPFNQFLREGIWSTVNTDDPVLFGNTTLSMEFYRLLGAHQMTMEDVMTIQYYSVCASFASPEEKMRIARAVGILNEGTSDIAIDGHAFACTA